MTTAERIRAIRQMMERRAQTTASSKSLALELLASEGIYSSNGKPVIYVVGFYRAERHSLFIRRFR